MNVKSEQSEDTAESHKWEARCQSDLGRTASAWVQKVLPGFLQGRCSETRLTIWPCKRSSCMIWVACNYKTTLKRYKRPGDLKFRRR